MTVKNITLATAALAAVFMTAGLAQEIFNRGMCHIEHGANPLKRDRCDQKGVLTSLHRFITPPAPPPRPLVLIKRGERRMRIYTLPNSPNSME